MTLCSVLPWEANIYIYIQYIGIISGLKEAHPQSSRLIDLGVSLYFRTEHGRDSEGLRYNQMQTTGSSLQQDLYASIDTFK